jgi:N-acetylmuramoyl-L-alanine amidase
VTHLVPSFTYRPVANTAGDAIRPIGLVLHVQVGNSSPYGWFNNPASQVSSTLWAGKNGEREQYVPSDRRAWAQANGNTSYDSIETEGFPNEALTAAQIETVAQAYADGVRTFGWALAVVDVPGESGLILHSDGGVGWGNHPECPGTIRGRQRAQIIARAEDILKTGDDDTVTEQDKTDIATAVLALLKKQVFSVTPSIHQPDAGSVIGTTYNKTGDVQSQLAWLTSAVQAIAAHDGVTLPPAP